MPANLRLEHKAIKQPMAPSLTMPFRPPSLKPVEEFGSFERELSLLGDLQQTLCFPSPNQMSVDWLYCVWVSIEPKFGSATKGTLQMWFQLRILRWGDHPGLPSSAQCNHMCPYKWKRGGKRVRVRQCGNDLTGHGWLWAKTWQQTLEAERDRKEHNPAYYHLDFSPRTPILNFWPSDCKITHMCS